MCRNLAGLSLMAVVVLCAGCGPSTEQEDHVQEVLRWRAERDAIMGSPDGFLALVGLFEVRSGESGFGSGEENEFHVAPAEGNTFAESIGVFERDGEVVTFRPTAGVEVTDSLGGVVVDATKMVYEGDEPTTLHHGSLTWVVIKRGTHDPKESALLPSALHEALGVKFFVRVWDAKSAALESLVTPEFYPIDPAWRLEGVYRAYDEPRVFYQKNVQGLVEETPTTGVVVFTKDGVEYELETADEGDNMFIVFGDDTNGDETWAGGRFMDIPKPDDGATVIVDFNQTRNPWCAYTPYSTCAYPTEQNTLPFAIRAGVLKPATSGTRI